jgi:hypothetical protein
MKTNIVGCARCGENHKDLEIKKLTVPIDISNTNGNKIGYWAMCPKLNEPILLIVLEDV